MTIAVGDPLPSIELQQLGPTGVRNITTDTLFGHGTSLLFAVPGAFTPTCSAAHLPGYVVNSDEILNKADRIVCLSVNDAFVMAAWGEHQHVGDRILMIADGSAHFTKAIGLQDDRDAQGMGVRSRRYAMIIRDGLVSHLNLEEPGAFEVSDAVTMLGHL